MIERIFTWIALFFIFVVVVLVIAPAIAILLVIFGCLSLAIVCLMAANYFRRGIGR